MTSRRPEDNRRVDGGLVSAESTFITPDALLAHVYLRAQGIAPPPFYERG